MVDMEKIIQLTNHQLRFTGGTGAEIIYALRNNPTLASSVLKNIALTGQSTRKIYQRSLPSNPNKDYYFIHRDTGNIEPLIIEYGFIDDNPTNVQFLNNNYKELAEAVIKSILEYKNVPYTPPISIPTNNTYTIKKGDTLYKIANQYNTTVNELKKLNNLTNNTLTIGSILKLPSNQTSTSNNIYTIKKGDTLYKIASQNNTTVDKLIELNYLTNNTLKIGDTLLLPSTEIIEIPTITKYYTINKGDTLYKIANEFNTTVEKIKQLNDLKNNILSIGQVIKIPSTEIIETPTTTKTYIVQPGDTLYKIAREYNTTINNLKELNNLTSNILSVGQNLIISP